MNIKNKIIHALQSLVILCSLNAAPQEINYQGRLTGSNGTPVTGNCTFGVKLFTATTGGTEIYSENVGAVALDSNGVYSFRFGANGSGLNSDTTTLAMTDGTKNVYSFTLSKSAVSGTVSISDGTYTWSQSSGSSSPANFLGAYDSTSKIASAIYLTGAPVAGKRIKLDYNYLDTGLTGALNQSGEQWLELSVNGVAQTPREKILCVPYAINALNVLNGPSFGIYEDKQGDVTYLAESNGFILATITDNNGSLPSLTIFVGDDSDNMSAIISEIGRNLNGNTITLPVGKGKYWKVRNTGSLSSVSVKFISFQ